MPEPPEKPEDSALMRRVQQGDDSAVTILYARWFKRIVAFLIRQYRLDESTAEDLVQDVLMKILVEEPGAYDPARNFGVFVFRCAHNKAIDFLRKSGRIAEWSDEFADGPDARTPGDLLELEEDSRRLWSCMWRLPAPQRLMLIARHWLDMSYEEIAQVLGCPEGSVASTLALARKNLKKCLGDEDESEVIL